MALPASDAFTGTNGTALPTYSANWATVNNTFNINTNAAHPTANDECCVRWAGDTFANDQYSQATVVAITAGIYVGVSCRCSPSAATYYVMYSDASDGLYFAKMVNGTWTQFSASSTELVVSDVARIEAEGTTIRPLKNGATATGLANATDSAISSGAAGLAGWGNGTGSRIDSFQADNIGGAPAPKSFMFASINPTLQHALMR